MYTNKPHTKIWLRTLLIVSVVLLLAGISAICVPALVHESDMNQDALDYAALSRETQINPAEHPTQVDEPLPHASHIPSQEKNDDAEHVPNTATSQQPNASTSASDSTRALKALKAQNSDFAGWLTIAGTNVDYPVVCSDNTDYYLTHNFNGAKSSLGTLFSLGKTDYGSSKNIAIYGHHITGSGQKMFKPLLSYKNKSFWQEHRTITLDTLSGLRTYTIFAVVNLVQDDWDPSTADFASTDDFMAFVDRAKDQAFFDTGVSVSASDRILTLITCDRSYAGKDGRLVVMAVMQ